MLWLRSSHSAGPPSLTRAACAHGAPPATAARADQAPAARLQAPRAERAPTSIPGAAARSQRHATERQTAPHTAPVMAGAMVQSADPTAQVTISMSAAGWTACMQKMTHYIAACMRMSGSMQAPAGLLIRDTLQCRDCRF